MRRVALLRGGDWADASVDLLDVPDDVDLVVERMAWNDWARRAYADGGSRTRYLYSDFVEWLEKRCGVVKNGDIEEFEA